METNKPQTGLGEYLRSEREKRHITIEQVASATKINVKLLHALESDNYDALPAKPFVRGFVTSYTRYVGLDHREVLARFDMYLDEKSGIKFKRPADQPHIFVEKEGTTDNSKTALTIVMVSFLVVAVIAFAILKPSLKHKRGRGKEKAVTNEEIMTVVPPPSESAPIAAKPAATPTPAATAGPAPAPEAEKTVTEAAKPAEAPAPAPTVAPTPAAVAKPAPAPTPKETPKPEKKTAAKPTPTPTASAAPAVAAGKVPPIPNNEVKHRLIVRAVEDAWVKYQVDDRPLQAYTLRKDKTIFVRARESIRFSTAKPSALEISFNNKDFRPLGSSAKLIVLPKEAEGQFKDNPFVPPNPAYLSTPN